MVWVFPSRGQPPPRGYQGKTPPRRSGARLLIKYRQLYGSQAPLEGLTISFQRLFCFRHYKR